MPNVLTVSDLKVYLKVDAGTVKAADGVSFRIPEGRTVALVGESGSGKSIIAQAIMGILPKIARIEGGEILFADPNRAGAVVDIARLGATDPELMAIRGGRISIIFQEPMTALSPLHTVATRLGRPCRCTAIWARCKGKRPSSKCFASSGFRIPRGPCRPIRSNFRAGCASGR